MYTRVMVRVRARVWVRAATQRKKPICRNIREAVKILSPLVINQNLLEYNLFSLHGSYNPRSQMSKLEGH